MSAQRLAVVLTVVNLILLLHSAMQTRPTAAQPVAPILRARAIELVDERNVVRMRLNVKESEIDVFDKTGAIGVKLGAGEDGSALVIAGGGNGSRLSCSRSNVRPSPCQADRDRGEAGHEDHVERWGRAGTYHQALDRGKRTTA